MINYIKLDNTVTDNNGQTAYTRARFSYIYQFEGAKTYAYVDSKGIPTIGIGFNLRDDNILQLVLDAFGMKVDKFSALFTTFHDIVKNSYASNTDLQTALNVEMAKQHTANPAIRTTFDFAAGDVGKEEMRAVFDDAVLIYDNSDITKAPLGRVDIGGGQILLYLTPQLHQA
jgi:hypothetical protein